MKALYETPEVERIDFAAMEAIAAQETRPEDNTEILSEKQDGWN